MASFNNGDRVKIIAGPHRGKTGTVLFLSLGGVRVHRDDTAFGEWDTYYPDELVLDIAAEGSAALAAELDAFLARLLDGLYEPTTFAPGRPLPRRTPVTTPGGAR